MWCWKAGTRNANNSSLKPTGTIEFMPPEVLLCNTSQFKPKPPYDVFSYGGVILHLVTGDWHKLDFHPNTMVLSEVQCHQQYLNKMNGKSATLKPLVEEFLADDSTERPTMTKVSSRIKNIKEQYDRQH